MDMVDYLDQGDVWINRDGVRITIDSMPALWRRNAAKWLVSHAEALRSACEVSRLRRDVLSGRVREEITGDLVITLAAVSKPDEWVKRTELYQALMAGTGAPETLASLIPGGKAPTYRSASGE